jgi:menaquinone-dependent protoporphyrinogen oxidase
MLVGAGQGASAFLIGGELMSSLIVYCSSHGTTSKAALLLRKELEGDVVVVNLNRTKLHSNVGLFDTVIIGGSIHAGSIQGKVRKFIKENRDDLMTKNIGLFLCCMREGQEAQQQFENAFPGTLRVRAVAKGFFGGEFLFSKMNFFEKQIVKRVVGITEDTCKLNSQAIQEFAQALNHRHILAEAATYSLSPACRPTDARLY